MSDSKEMNAARGNSAWLYVLHDTAISVMKGRIEPNIDAALNFNFYPDSGKEALPFLVSKWERKVDCPTVFFNPFEKYDSKVVAYFWMRERDDELAKKIFEAYFDFRLSKLNEYLNELIANAEKSKKVFESALSAVHSVDICETEEFK